MNGEACDEFFDERGASDPVYCKLRGRTNDQDDDMGEQL
jgi:hypothetical protein